MPSAPRWRRCIARACAVLQDRVLPTARRATVALTRQRAARVVLAIDPEGMERRRRQARCARDVWVTAEQDGHSLLIARMATTGALACLSAIDAAATDPRLEADGRLERDATIGERRTEVLARMILTGARTQAGTPDPSPRVRVHVEVTIPLDALLGLSTAPGQLAAGSGRGPRIDAAIDEIRDLLADPDTGATLRRLVTDPITGHLLDVGRTRYRIPERLREFVTTRDRTCRFPGCQHRATGCQLDHALPWSDGGETSRANLGALCVRHHQLKTHSGWHDHPLRRRRLLHLDLASGPPPRHPRPIPSSTHPRAPRPRTQPTPTHHPPERTALPHRRCHLTENELEVVDA